MNVLETLLNRRWILKSRDRELYYQVRTGQREKISDGKGGIPGDRESVSDPGGEDTGQGQALDGNPPVSGSAAICVFMPDLKLSGSAGGGRSVCFVAADGFCAGTVPGGAD